MQLGLARSAAPELTDRKITVNAVLPGSIRTGGPEELYREGSSSAEIGQGDSIVTGP